MSLFRIGADGDRMDADLEHQAEGWDRDDGIDWGRVEWVEVEGVTFARADLARRIPTPSNDRALDAIREYRAERGCSPTIRELAAALGVSPSTAEGHVRRLERRGLVEVDRRRPRGVRPL